MQQLKREDLLKFKFLSGIELSPDGELAAFTVAECDEKENGYKKDIWLYENGAARRLTAGGDAGSFFFEDGTHILFPADRDKSLKERREAGEKLTVFQRIDVRGGEATPAFTVPLAAGTIKKLKSGKYAVLADYAAGEPDFAALDDGAKARYAERLKEEKDYQLLEEIPFWANGEGFTNGHRSRLYIFDPVTGKAAPVTDEATNVGELFVDGDRIYFAANRFENKMELTSGAYVYDAAAGALTELLPDGRYMIDRLFEKDGQVVFFGADMKGGLYDYRQMPDFCAIENGEARIIYEGDEDPDETVASDCRYGGGRAIRLSDGQIYYATASGTGTKLVKLSLDGTRETLISRAGSIDCFDMKGGRLVFIGMTGETLQELYEGAEEKRLTAFNGWVNEERYIAELKPADFEGEGGLIEGFYLEPRDYEPGKKYPAILDIHGGPLVAYGRAFFHEMQVWANAGYFVFFCNPRGGDGRGEAFGDIRGKYGTIDYDDLMAFTDHVLELCPDIDASRLGVTGGSYGGYMTNWIIGHTDRFKAAVSQRSISNWISKFGTTDIGYFFNAIQIRSTPWDNAEKLWWHSPLKYADRAVTPTLFIHSDEDYRCWMAEGLQMFTALKYHGVDARLCLFHGESHELSRSGKPKHRLRRLEEMENWFDKYLKK